MSIRRLITEADVLAGRVESPIVLDEGTVITPSARDRALSRGIAVVERDAARPAGPAATPAAPVGHGVWSPAAAAATHTTPAPAAPSCAGGCGTCGGGGCARCRPSGATLDGLPDGTYLIVVRDGRVVSTLPNSGPGLMPRGA